MSPSVPAGSMLGVAPPNVEVATTFGDVEHGLCAASCAECTESSDIARYDSSKACGEKNPLLACPLPCEACPRPAALPSTSAQGQQDWASKLDDRAALSTSFEVLLINLNPIPSPACTENRGCYTIPHNAQEWGAYTPLLITNSYC